MARHQRCKLNANFNWFNWKWTFSIWRTLNFASNTTQQTTRRNIKRRSKSTKTFNWHVFAVTWQFSWLTWFSDCVNVVSIHRMSFWLSQFECFAESIFPSNDISFAEKYREESRKFRETFKENNKRFRQSILQVIGHTSRDVTSCSPDNYLFGKTVNGDGNDSAVSSTARAKNSIQIFRFHTPAQSQPTTRW